MLDDYDQGGMLPKWAQANGESYVMVGDPADAIIADAYAFGARDFDAAQGAAGDGGRGDAAEQHPPRAGRARPRRLPAL